MNVKQKLTCTLVLLLGFVLSFTGIDMIGYPNDNIFGFILIIIGGFMMGSMISKLGIITYLFKNDSKLKK